MQIKNIKASFIFSEDLIEGKRTKEMFTSKQKDVVLTIYKHTPNLLNITGIKSFGHLVLTKEEMEKKFNKSISEMRIDNIFLSKKNHMNIDLNRIFDYLKGHEKFYASYVHELFPGMHLKPKDKTFPTIGLFRTGSFTMMGSKNVDAICESEMFVNSLIERFEK